MESAAKTRLAGASALRPNPPQVSQAPRAAWALLRPLLTVALDLALLGSGLAAAVEGRLALRPIMGPLSTSHSAPSLYLTCGSCWFAVFIYERIYGTGLAAADQMDRIVKALSAGLVVIILLSFGSHTSVDISRIVLFGWYAFNLLLFMLVRPWLLRLLVSVSPHSLVLVVADDVQYSTPLCVALAKLGYHTRVVPLAFDPTRQDKTEISTVVLYLPASASAGPYMRSWEQSFPQIGIIPESALAPLGSQSKNLHGIQLFTMEHPLERLTNRAIKRTLDVVAGALLCLVSAPLWLLLAIAVKLDSPGPVYFRQKRLGRHGRQFSIFKFRSMSPDADQRLAELLADNDADRLEFAATFKLKQDPRITRVGRFIRRYSLDELPQLWNVLRGDMSLVGPRPIVEAEVALYGDVYPIIASVRPGLTGIWQTSGRSDTSYESRRRFDLLYVREWTLSRDVAALLQTIAAVFAPHAY